VLIVRDSDDESDLVSPVKELELATGGKATNSSGTILHSYIR
jgi:hypothetical protein